MVGVQRTEQSCGVVFKDKDRKNVSLYFGKKNFRLSTPGRSGAFGNVQNEQFQGRHFYVPFGEFVHLHIYTNLRLIPRSLS